MATFITPGGAARADATANFLANLPAFTSGGVARQTASVGAVLGPDVAKAGLLNTAGSVLFGDSKPAVAPPAAASLPVPPAVPAVASAAPEASPVLPTLTATQAQAAPTGTNLSDRSIVSTGTATPAGVPSYQSAIEAGYQRQQQYGDVIAGAIQKYVDAGGSKDNRSYRAAHAINALPAAYGPNNGAGLSEAGATAAAGQQTQRDIETQRIGFERQKLAETPVPTGQRIDTSAGYGIPVTTYGVRLNADGSPQATFGVTQPAATPAGTTVEGSRSTSGGHPIVYRGGKWVKVGDAQ